MSGKKFKNLQLSKRTYS